MLEHARYAECLGKISEIDGIAQPDQSARSVHRFSFSDSFVLATNDVSPDSLNAIIVSTCLMAQALFAMKMPVRGAIVRGEADFVPNSDHMVGSGVIEAADLEKKQDWFGVMLDGRIGSFEQISASLHPGVRPMVIRYPIPLKDIPPEDGTALNWRLNIFADLGTRSFFAPSDIEADRRKLEATLAFAKHVRETHQAYTPLPNQFPWLRPVFCPVAPLPEPPFDLTTRHGDEF